MTPHVNANQVAQIIDIMPTLLDICSGDIPPTVQGRSLFPILTGKCDTIEDSAAFIETAHGKIRLRTPTHLYGIQLADDRRTIANTRFCFYDLHKDPYEQHNQAEIDTKTDLADGFGQRLEEWNQNTPWLAP